MWDASVWFCYVGSDSAKPVDWARWLTGVGGSVLLGGWLEPPELGGSAKKQGWGKKSVASEALMLKVCSWEQQRQPLLL